MVWLRRRRSLIALLGVLLCLWGGAAGALAQKDSKSTAQAKGPRAKAETPEPDPARKPPETLLELIVAGGPLNIAFLSVLGLFSLVAVAVILERLVNLTQRKLIPEGFVQELRELVRRGE